MVSTLGVI